MPPATAAAIRPSAGAAAIRAAERATSRRWPAQLVALYELADGTARTPAGFLLPWMRPLPLAEVATTWAMMQEVWAGLRRQFQVVDIDEHRRHLNLLAQTPGATLPPDPYDVDRLEVELAGSEAGMFLPSFVPIAENQSGDYLFVDLRHGTQHGCVTHYRKDSADWSGSAWPSIETMLADIATALETGGWAGQGVPVVDGDRLHWELESG